MLRRLFLTPDAQFKHIAYTVEELCTLTGKSEVNIRTALTDLRSPKFCGGEDLSLRACLRRKVWRSTSLTSNSLLLPSRRKMRNEKARNHA